MGPTGFPVQLKSNLHLDYRMRGTLSPYLHIVVMWPLINHSGKFLYSVYSVCNCYWLSRIKALDISREALMCTVRYNPKNLQSSLGRKLSVFIVTLLCLAMLQFESFAMFISLRYSYTFQFFFFGSPLDE